MLTHTAIMLIFMLYYSLFVIALSFWYVPYCIIVLYIRNNEGVAYWYILIILAE